MASTPALSMICFARSLFRGIWGHLLVTVRVFKISGEKNGLKLLRNPFRVSLLCFIAILGFVRQ